MIGVLLDKGRDVRRPSSDNFLDERAHYRIHLLFEVVSYFKSLLFHFERLWNIFKL